MLACFLGHYGDALGDHAGGLFTALSCFCIWGGLETDVDKIAFDLVGRLAVSLAFWQGGCVVRASFLESVWAVSACLRGFVIKCLLA